MKTINIRHRLLSAFVAVGVFLSSAGPAAPSPDPAHDSLRQTNARQGAQKPGLEDALQPAGMEEAQVRLDQLANLQGTTGQELREALWAMPYAPDPNQPLWTRETLLEEIRLGHPVIPAVGLTAVPSPWGEVDLSRLNDLSQYPEESAAYDIARDIEIAVALGLLRVQRVSPSKAVGPSGVYRALKSEGIGSAASISWADALLLREKAQTLHSTGQLTLGSVAFTFQAGSAGQPPVFTVDDLPVTPDKAQMAFYDALGIVHYGAGHSALPTAVKQAFEWKWLVTAGLEEAEQVVGQLEDLLTAARKAVGEGDQWGLDNLDDQVRDLLKSPEVRKLTSHLDEASPVLRGRFLDVLVRAHLLFPLSAESADTASQAALDRLRNCVAFGIGVGVSPTLENLAQWTGWRNVIASVTRLTIPPQAMWKPLEMGCAAVIKPPGNLKALWQLQKRVGSHEMDLCVLPGPRGKLVPRLLISEEGKTITTRRLGRMRAVSGHTHGSHFPLEVRSEDTDSAEAEAEVGTTSIVLAFDLDGRAELAVFEPGAAGWRYVDDQRKIAMELRKLGVLAPAAGKEGKTAAGQEEKTVPPPVVPDWDPATIVWQAGWGVFPSTEEHLRRTAFMAPLGGPAQYLQIGASVHPGPLPKELSDEGFETKDGRQLSLIDHLPTEGLASGHIADEKVHPYIQLTIQKVLANKAPTMWARVHLESGDVAVPMRPINVWTDGAIRYEGFIPAEPQFLGDHSFTIELFWNNRWYHLKDEGWARIEPPNPAQVAAQASPEELKIGLLDAKEELNVALGQMAQRKQTAAVMEEGEEKQILLEAIRVLEEEGVVTDPVLDFNQRAPLIRQLVMAGKLTWAQARRAFVAAEQATGLQKEFFTGMQFKQMLLAGGQRVLIMFNPNRANTPRPPEPKPGEKPAHPLGNQKPAKVVVDGQVRIIKQRALPSFVSTLVNWLMLKLNPFGYVHGHGTLPVTDQKPQEGWEEAITGIVNEACDQADRLAVIAGNIGELAAASLPDWAHLHDIPWRMPIDNPGDGQTRWFRLESGIRTGVLRDPNMTTFIMETEVENKAALVEAGKRLVASLQEGGLGQYNAWAAVSQGLVRLFIVPRNPKEPEPPADQAVAANWKVNADRAKPLADQNYWFVEISPRRYTLMTEEQMRQCGLRPVQGDPATGRPFGPGPHISPGRPVIDIKMGIMELRRFVLLPRMELYEDPFLGARLVKAYELVGLPWSDPRIAQIVEEIDQPEGELERDSEEEIRHVLDSVILNDVIQITEAKQLVDLVGRISEWRTRHVDAFHRRSGPERDRFLQTLEDLCVQFAESVPDLVRVVPPPQADVPPPDSSQSPLILGAENPAWDRGARYVSRKGETYIEIWGSAGGPEANLAQASAALGRPTHLAVNAAGETGDRLVESLLAAGVSVSRTVPAPDQPPTRTTFLVESDRPGRRERRLVGEGAPASPPAAEQVQALLSTAAEGHDAYATVIGERWVGPQAAQSAQALVQPVAAAQAANQQGYVIANDSWDAAIWGITLKEHPRCVSCSLKALAGLVQQDPTLLQPRPEEVARLADELRRQHGVGEWLVSIGAGNVVLVTDEGWWHGVPSPVLELTALSGAVDAGNAAYRSSRDLGKSASDALLASCTASTLYMENGRYPTSKEIQKNLFRALVDILPRPAAGLDETEIDELEGRIADRLGKLAEAREGKGLLVVPEDAFKKFKSLDLLLERLPEPLAKSVIVWGASQQVEALHKANAHLEIVRETELEALKNSIVMVAVAQGSRRVGVLGDLDLVERLDPLLWQDLGFGAEIVYWDLSMIARILGIPPAAEGVDLEGLAADLEKLASA